MARIVSPSAWKKTSVENGNRNRAVGLAAEEQLVPLEELLNFDGAGVGPVIWGNTKHGTVPLSSGGRGYCTVDAAVPGGTWILAIVLWFMVGPRYCTVEYGGLEMLYRGYGGLRLLYLGCWSVISTLSWFLVSRSYCNLGAGGRIYSTLGFGVL